MLLGILVFLVAASACDSMQSLFMAQWIDDMQAGLPAKGAEVYLEVAQTSCGKTLTPEEKHTLEIKKLLEKAEKACEKDREERDIARQKLRARKDKEAEERRAHREAKEDKDRAHEKARELKRVKEDEDWEAEFAAALRDRSAKRLKKLADAEAAEQNSGEFH